MSDDLRVSVDRDFARFGSKSFAINKINTVDVQMSQPHSQNAAFVWGLLAILSLLLFRGDGSGLFVSLLIFALFGFLAYRAWKKSAIRVYLLFLVTSSGAVQAIKSEDRSMIEDLRDRIEHAIAGRTA